MQIKLIRTIYDIDIIKVFNEATDDDYIDCYDSVGVLIHNSPLPDGFTLMINYNLSKDVIKGYIENEELDFYDLIKESDIKTTPNERERIVKELSFI